MSQTAAHAPAQELIGLCFLDVAGMCPNRLGHSRQNKAGLGAGESSGLRGLLCGSSPSPPESAPATCLTEAGRSDTLEMPACRGHFSSFWGRVW